MGNREQAHSAPKPRRGAIEQPGATPQVFASVRDDPCRGGIGPISPLQGSTGVCRKASWGVAPGYHIPLLWSLSPRQDSLFHLPIFPVFLAFLCLISVASAADWPGFQGADRSNRSPDTGLLKAWPLHGPKLLWSTDGIGPRGFSSVAVSGGLIYTAGVKNDRQEYITALDLNGKVRWRTAVGLAFLRTHGGSRATPTVSGGRLYHLGGLGTLLCLDAKTGEKKWSVDLPKKFGSKPATWGYAESPLVDGDKVFITPGGKSVMVALDAATGETQWTTTGFTSWSAMCSPIIIEHNGTRQIITLTAKYAISVDRKTGRLNWRHRHKTSGGVHCTTPAYQAGSIYCSTGYGAGGIRLDLPTGEAKLPTAKWSDKTLDNHHGGVALAGGHIYGSSYKGRWVCLDFKTGEAKYVARGVGKGAVTFADGMLYCLSERGTLALVRATPEKYDEVSRFKLPSGGDRQYWSRPVVIGRRLYIRHSDTLFAYDVAAGQH
jgi:outer membrane protein assembly factor BamB